MGAASESSEGRLLQAVVHAALRNVVHDLNNPLGTITMAAAALRSAGDPAQRAELIDLIEREAMRAGAAASAAAERTAIAATPMPMRLDDLLEAVRDRCRSAGVDATFACEDGTTRLVADPTLLPHALAAFVVDAAASPDRDQPVEVGFRVAGDTIEVSIRDDGAPVTTERARRAFLPFPDADAHDTRAVGLAVAAGRAHVRGLGGRAELLPGRERGNTVRLRLPLVEVSAASPRAAADDGREPRHVLVVDDDQTMRDMLEVVLRREGWTTAAAQDGAAAAALVRERPVDLVLLDLHVGAEHGPDIAARLERQRPGLASRVVYLSGDVPSSGRIDDRPAIAKPFVLEELYRVAETVAAAAGPL